MKTKYVIQMQIQFHVLKSLFPPWVIATQMDNQEMLNLEFWLLLLLYKCLKHCINAIV